ncbi:hypothetical protein [Bdellovibrio sp. HCB2-146]|uniref:hypothetical protein n=1 Tax=Bdellovibrio sp. HCB2-146 TaxID=3394362 RepID=UPI0039BD19FE
MLGVSIWVTGCGPGSTNNNYFDTNKTPNSGGASSNFGGGGATGDGGGGQGVECGENTKNSDIRNRLFVRDIYEAVIDKDLKMKTVPGVAGTDAVSDDALEVLANSLKSYFGPASYSLEFTKVSFWKRLVNAIVFLEEDHKLISSQDANSPIHLQPGCTAVQIAFWDESSGVPNEHKLYVNRRFWRSLDQLNKIGLLAHEVFYAQARKAGYKNSDTVRNKIGQLLSTEGLTPLFTAYAPSKVPSIKDVLPENSKGFKTCEGTSQTDPDAKIHMYQYQGTDGKQYFTFPVVSSNSINSAYLQSTSFPFDPNKNSSLAAATDLLYFQSQFHDGDNYFEPNLDIFYDRWYSNASLLTPRVDISMQNFYNRLPLRVGQESILWTGHLRSSPQPITLFLLNSTTDWNQRKQRTALTTEQKLIEINIVLKSEIVICGAKSGEAEGVIALLYKEIKTAIQNGSYPHGFPQWTKALEQISNRNNKCDLPNNEQISREYPAYLYSLHLKTDKNHEAEETLHESLLYKAGSSQAIPLGKIRLSQGSNSLEFDLRCNDYSTAYAEVVLQKNKPAAVVRHKVTSLLSEAGSDLPAESLNNISRFMTLIQSSDEYNRNVVYPAFIKTNTPSSDRPLYPSEQYRAFLTNLSIEKDVTFSRCKQNMTNDYNEQQVKYRDTNCLIATFNKSQHRYMIYFSYELKTDQSQNNAYEEVPTLEFVQLISSVD